MTDASKEYRERLKHIEMLLGIITAGVESRGKKERVDWADAGDLGRIRSLLLESAGAVINRPDIKLEDALALARQKG